MKLTPELLLRAYAIGIFPMAESRHAAEVRWIEPQHRGVLPLDQFHVPRRLKRTLRQGDHGGSFEVRCDSAFARMVALCAAPRPGRRETWINPLIEHLYRGLFEMGFAHSVEVWQAGQLAGGLYGVSLGGAFFGESMVSLERDASKIALAHLVLRLRKGGYALLDTQFETPHLSQFGVIEVHRDDYRKLLADAIATPARFPAGPLEAGEMEAFLSPPPAKLGES
jgi:leucyl/phenylalanyl-tRNA--protein transferase